MANSVEMYYQPMLGRVDYPDGSMLNQDYGPYLSRSAIIVKPDPTRRKKPEGWLYPTPYNFYKLVERHDHEDLTYYNQFENSTVSYFGPAQRFSSGYLVFYRLEVTPAMVDRVIVKALLKLKDQKFNAGVALAEARQTANLVGSTASRLAFAFRSLKRGRFAEARRYLGLKRSNQPANWLELQYGWKPLLSDVHGAANELARRSLDNGSWVTTVKATVREEAEYDLYHAETHPIDRMHVTGTAEASTFIRLDYEPENDMAKWASRLGLTNPLEIAWELVPYSFVVDWFLPVGSWLSVLDATLGYKFKSGSRSDRTTCKMTGVRAGYNDPSFVYQNPRWSTGSSLVSEKSLNRVVYESSPFPSFPRIKNPLSLGHMANGLSLLAQAFGRR